MSLVLYEGLRPILAKKNRYFQDPSFGNGFFPPPKRAAPGLAGARGAAPVPPPASSGAESEGPQFDATKPNTARRTSARPNASRSPRRTTFDFNPNTVVSAEDGR